MPWDPRGKSASRRVIGMCAVLLAALAAPVAGQRTSRVSVDSSGVQTNGRSTFPPHGGISISADGRSVAFECIACNLVAGDMNATWDVFVRDRRNDSTERVSVQSSGAQSNFGGEFPSLSADGRYVAFYSWSTNRAAPVEAATTPRAPAARSSPPREAPPSRRTASFTTSGENPTATSVLLQGTTSPASGAVYGQGVRCVGGILKRLYTRGASGGSITVPDYAVGDWQVSQRSLAQGNPISAGQSRWYLVFYRDPIVLGGCPSSGTFNATQTGEVAWSP